jgi:hypothetical protein
MWAVEQKHPEAVKALLAAGADPSAKSGGAGLPRNYMAPRLNQRAVLLAQDRRRRAAAAGISYEEQLARDQKSGVEIGGQRGLGQALDANGNPLPATPGRQGGAAGPAQPQQTPAPAPAAAAPTPPAGEAAAGARAGRHLPPALSSRNRTATMTTKSWSLDSSAVAAED